MTNDHQTPTERRIIEQMSQMGQGQTDALVEQIKEDREAGTPGPWTWETESSEWPDHSLVAGDGEAVLYWDFDYGFRFNSRKDEARISRVPDMEARILADADRIEALEAENARLRGTLRDALDEILTLYAWSDQVGLYDIEETPAVVKARAALAETEDKTND